MPNSEGTRGFISVLARDRHGLFVVVELKRSDSAAREAIHEVLKYCELAPAAEATPGDAPSRKIDEQALVKLP